MSIPTSDELATGHEPTGGRTPDAWFDNVPAIPYVRLMEGSGLPFSSTITHIGPRCSRLLGYAPGEFIDDPHLWTSRIHSDDLGRVLSTWQRTNQTGGRYHLTYRMIARDGRVVQVLDEAGYAEDIESDARSWNGVVVDVTGDGSLAADMRDAEETYRRLVEQVPTVIYVDEVPPEDPTEVTPVYISPQIEGLLGYRPEEWLRDPDLWDRAIHPDDAEAANAEASRSYAGGSPLNVEYRMIARDGRTVWVREEATLFRDPDGVPKFWQGVYVDITELKRSEETLNDALERERDASERLRALDEMKNTFLQAVSHDLRTPLAAILGLALTIARDDVHLDLADIRDMATRIASNSRKLDQMVTDLLDLDRLSRGIIEPKLRDADIGQIVREVVEQFEVTEDRTVVLDVEPVVIPADPPKLERIVENLLVNTARHTPKGSRAWLRTRAQDGGAMITVEDDGPGVPADLHEAVFEPFHQGPSRSQRA
ncbi:MAG: PAS domain-containing protein, partial [Actinomycetota bacterium]